jgi:DNA-binding MarR family transcriptional regulator/GNAT superfamily N-acetyltransferase
MHPPDRIEAVRRFNRFYTRRIGVLNEGLLDSDFTLTECRILWELAHLEEAAGITATDLGRRLDLDGGYLSRLLRSLKERGFIKATRSKDDARQSHLLLTAAGRRAFAPLDQRSQRQVDALLSRLGESQQQDLLHAFQRVQALLDDDDTTAATNSVTLRPHQPGDIGWIIFRHGAIYAHEYHWDMRFEAMVARIAADFIDHFDARREACWIAERDGARLGSVCLVQARDDTTHEPVEGVAQLRLLLVEPSARGFGIGAALVKECVNFARAAGYKKMRLWTNDVLVSARKIYQSAGFELVEEEKHSTFGKPLTSQTWEMSL